MKFIAFTIWPWMLTHFAPATRQFVSHLIGRLETNPVHRIFRSVRLECTLTVGSEYSGLKGEHMRHALFGALMVGTAGADASVTRAIGGPGSHTCAGVPGAILQGVPQAVLSKAPALVYKPGPNGRFGG